MQFNSNNNRFAYINYLMLMLTYCVICSCNPTKKLSPSEALVIKNKIEVDGKSIEKETLSPIIKQKPNRKSFSLFRFHLGVYNLFNHEKIEQKRIRKESKLSLKNEKRLAKGKSPKPYRQTTAQWIVNVIGEEPTIYDPILTEKSTHNLNQYLKNNGYFNGYAQDSVIIKKKRATVFYHITPKQPYKLRKIAFSMDDLSIKEDVIKCTKKTLLKPSSNYSSDILEKERLRIANEMKNLGYYKFNKEYVYFKVDTTLKSNSFDVSVVIKNASLQLNDSTPTLLPHNKYTVKDIFINPEYRPHLTKIHRVSDTLLVDSINYVVANNIVLRPEIYNRTLFIKPNSLFSLKNAQYTHQHISDTRTFNYIRISYDEAKDTSGHYLNCNIFLTPVAKQSVSIETEGTNKGGFLGVAGNFVYKNKNVFKGAETFQFKINTGIEVQPIIADGISNSETTIEQYTPFNTLEIGPELSLFIPNLVLPFSIKKFPQIGNPTTNYTLAFSHQQRADFNRQFAKVSYGYSWNNSKYNSFQVYPIDISYVNIQKSDFFENWLENTQNSYLINSYQDHFIVASKLSYTFNNQNINKFKNFSYAKIGLEAAGNILNTIHKNSSRETTTDENYELFGVQYAQYLKPEIELRKYNVVNRHSSMVYRLFTGVGIPYGNLNVLPFEKSYFGGGSNGIRAWSSRSLGPGALHDTLTQQIDQIGDIRIELNAEYRFDIIDILDGAAFIDAGNIWLMNKDTLRPNTQFDFQNFHKQMGVGVGFGLRADLEFFIVRLDVGLPIHDPSLEEGERWIFQPKANTNLSRFKYFGESYTKYRPKPVFNIGIGYPF